MAVSSCGLSRRNVLMLRMVFLMTVVFTCIGYLVPVTDSLKNLKIVPSILSRLCPTPPAPPPVIAQRSPVVNGIPTKRLRENLRNDTYYITGWSGAGFTNAVINFANMIYLGKLTDRVPIVPPFAPAAHISKSAGVIPFGDIFDLDVLRKTLNMDILDWRDVKDLPARDSLDPYSTTEIEHLGCWTTVPEGSTMPATGDNTVHHIGLDVSYTRIPSFARLPTDLPDFSETHVVFAQLAALAYPLNPLVNLENTKLFYKSPEGYSLKPDTHLSCFDSLYYSTSGVRAFEWELSWSPAWHTIGKNLHFTQAIEDLAHSYMIRAFGLANYTDLPNFIAIHIRHGDFHGQCEEHTHKQDGNDCFPTLSSYGNRVNEIKAELLKRRRISVSSVIVMSDETSNEFWNDVKAQGWAFVNHTAEATIERYGEWYAPIMDTVIQSHAIGFVGTKGSTFSLIGERRVQDWHGGVYRDVSIREGH